MKTTVSVKTEDADRKWWIIDFADSELTLGRAAARIAGVLRGKHKASYTPHADTGDFVIVLNADKAKLTGKKESDKVYYRHTGYIGGLKSITADKLRATKPTELVSKAVKGMLPHNPLGRKVFRKLKVYAGSEHPHQAQQPEPLDLSKV